MEDQTNPSRESRIEVRILVQNLQKQAHLASDLISQYNPDFLLAQEINLCSETDHDFSEANFTSRHGYGTAIFRSTAQQPLSRVGRVESPQAEIGGCIRKKTTLATAHIHNGAKAARSSSTSVQLISFHGYNGQPFQNASYLVDHVQAVLNEASRGCEEAECAIFAGDFNTWTPAHLDGIRIPLEQAGYRHVLSWPYPGRDFPLDHVFLKGNVNLENSTVFKSKSDHQGVLLSLSFTCA